MAIKLQEVRESALALPRRSRAKLLRELTASLEPMERDSSVALLADDDPDLEAKLRARIAEHDRLRAPELSLHVIQKEFGLGATRNVPARRPDRAG